MTPWSVRPIAGMPRSLARANIFGIRLAPSSIEYSEWEWRWTKLNPDLRRKREKSLHGCNLPESSPAGWRRSSPDNRSAPRMPTGPPHRMAPVTTEPKTPPHRKPGGARKARKPAGSRPNGAAAGAAAGAGAGGAKPQTASKRRAAAEAATRKARAEAQQRARRRRRMVRSWVAIGVVVVAIAVLVVVRLTSKPAATGGTGITAADPAVVSQA